MRLRMKPLLLALSLGACGQPPVPTRAVRPVARTPEASTVKASTVKASTVEASTVEPNDVEPITCPGGLLCEARTSLLGWRIPVGCEPELARSHVAACWLAEAQIARVAEFFRSRYRVDQVPEGLQVHPLHAPLLGTDPPLLQVLVRPQGIELVALAGAGTAATP
jgi:hypothetical protein